MITIGVVCGTMEDWNMFQASNLQLSPRGVINRQNNVAYIESEIYFKPILLDKPTDLRGYRFDAILWNGFWPSRELRNMIMSRLI